MERNDENRLFGEQPARDPSDWNQLAEEQAQREQALR